jgi:predicted metalloprotease
VGGGIGGLIMLILMLIFGGGAIGGDNTRVPDAAQSGQSSPLDQGQVSAAGQQSGTAFSEVPHRRRRQPNDQCLVIATVNRCRTTGRAPCRSTASSTPGKTVIYSGATQSGCGTASNQVGPFYCPLDSRVYIDASFFDELSSRFGADGGNLAKEYVIAHEYGHHIQNVLGILGKAQQDPQGPQSGAVKVELMADCLAGTWVKHATETKDANGVAFLKPISQKDIDSALSAASAVGDDRIQETMQGRVTPENWTHGSSAQRQKWFMAGYTSGDINQCNTFGVSRV